MGSQSLNWSIAQDLAGSLWTQKVSLVQRVIPCEPDGLQRIPVSIYFQNDQKKRQNNSHKAQ
jgi:hypothetical protein